MLNKMGGSSTTHKNFPWIKRTIVYVYMPNSRKNIENTSFDHLMKFTKYSLANQAWWDIYIYCKQY